MTSIVGLAAGSGLATDASTADLAGAQSEAAADEMSSNFKNEMQRTRKNKIVELLLKSLALGLLVGLIAGGVYILTGLIASGSVQWRNVLAGAVSSAFLTAALTFAINAARF